MLEFLAFIILGMSIMSASTLLFLPLYRTYLSNTLRYLFTALQSGIGVLGYIWPLETMVVVFTLTAIAQAIGTALLFAHSITE